jgi:hypothetical protein
MALRSSQTTEGDERVLTTIRQQAERMAAQH